MMACCLHGKDVVAPGGTFCGEFDADGRGG